MILSCLFVRATVAGEKPQVESKAVLTVVVTNSTANGTAVTDDIVTVQIYDHVKLLHSLEGKVDADGRVLFENVPTGDKIIALARAKHNDMMFSAPPVALKPAADKHLASVEVFDVSYDKSKLSVQTHHLIIKTTPNALHFTEFFQLVNSSDMAVSSKQTDAEGRTIVLEIMLPKGFDNLEASSYFQEDAVVVTDTGFYDTMAVPPGEYQVTFTYTLDITSNSLDIVKGITLPTTNFVVFTELGQAKLQGLGRPSNRMLGKDSMPIEYYTRDKLVQGDKIAFQITGFNVNSSSGKTTWVVLALVFGAVLVLVVLRPHLQKN